MNPRKKKMYVIGGLTAGAAMIVGGLALEAQDVKNEREARVAQVPVTTTPFTPTQTPTKSVTPSPDKSTVTKKSTPKPSQSKCTAGIYCPGKNTYKGYPGDLPVDEPPLVEYINELKVAREYSGPEKYDRDLFKYNSERTRPFVLNSEKREDGTWYSRWDNVYYRDPGNLEIDHTVALKEAWDSGAYAWTEIKRERFANDLESEYVLNAITTSLNRSKSDYDGAWEAPRNRCEYVRQVATVKHQYDLSVDPEEKDVMLSVAWKCDQVG